MPGCVRAAARGHLMLSSCLPTRAKAQPPQPRESSPALHPTSAPDRRAAAAGRCRPRRSRGRLKDGRRRPEPCGVRRTWLRWTAEDPQCHCAPRGTPPSIEYAPGLFKETALPINKEHSARASSCCSIEQLPCKQLLDAQSLSDEPRGPWKPQTFSHSFSHPRQQDAGQQSQQRLLAFATRAF